jgi:Avidin family
MAIDGTWYNELGSTMDLQYGPIPGQIAGTYQSGVGTSGQFALVGSYDPNNNTVGFVVTWNNGTVERNSTTTWCGQYFNNTGDEALITMWLLCGSTPQSATWDSTLVGQDVFTRSQPSAAEVATKQGLRAPAHPRALDAS